MYILYYILLYFSQCHSNIAHPNSYIFLNSILLLLGLCVLCVLLRIVRYYCTITVLKHKHFATPSITSAKHVYVTNNIAFDVCLSVPWPE